MIILAMVTLNLFEKKLDSLKVFKIFKATVEFKKNNKFKAVSSYRRDGFYEKYNEIGRNPRRSARFCETCVIKVQYTMPETPKQNGITERKNCTLIDMVRCMISHFTLPILCGVKPYKLLYIF